MIEPVRVFKYRGGDESIFVRDLESLEKDTFWAPTRDALNDPCEGLISSEVLLNQIDFILKLFGRGRKEINDSVDSVKKCLNDLLDKKDSAGVYSLSRNCTDELLWAHYANNHKGFCIEYDLDTLVHFGKNDYFNFNVTYSDYPPKLNINDIPRTDDRVKFIQKIIGVKSKKWAYEKETRVITSISGPQNYDYRAVKAIYFGLRMPDERRHEIMKKLCGRGIKYYHICLKKNSYKFAVEPLEDSYPTDKKYLYSIAPIAEYAVDPGSLNEAWSDFSPYLQKMAEIVRREPYCNEVLMVEVSHEKSKPGNPVFFGQYQRSEYRYDNFYLTPSEIDEQYSKISDLGVDLENV